MGTALVTGASAGLGLEFAWQLATAKHDVVLVARDEEALTRLARQLEAAAGVRAEVLPADLTDRGDVERVAQRLRTDERPVGLLVNNAGMGLNQHFVGGDLAREESALDLMVRTVMVLSHEAAGAMVRRGRGAILNVGSVAGLVAAGSYSAHKAWVRVFTEALAAELKGTGVTATVVAPGFTHTEFQQRARIDTRHYPEAAWLDAEDVVAAALADVRRGVVISTPSLRYKALSALLRVAPRSAVRAVGSYRRALPDEDVRPEGTPGDDGAATADHED